jgi:hypothetical protein
VSTHFEMVNDGAVVRVAVHDACVAVVLYAGVYTWR